MSKLDTLKYLVNQRLTCAGGDISGLFERTMAEDEQELSSLKEANARQRKLLDAISNPDIRLERADVQQLLVVNEEVLPEQQVWRSSLDQEDPEPLHIKENQKDPEPPPLKKTSRTQSPPH